MNQFNYPECPRDIEELSSLIYALTAEKFDKTPEELERELEELKEKLRKKGTSEEMILACGKILQYTSEDEETRTYMKRWGRNRREAIRNYMTHFKKPCNWCMDIYTDILASNTLDRIQEEKVDIESEPEKVYKLLLKAHLDYLGNPNLGEGSCIKLEDFLITPN